LQKKKCTFHDLSFLQLAAKINGDNPLKPDRFALHRFYLKKIHLQKPFFTITIIQLARPS